MSSEITERQRQKALNCTYLILSTIKNPDDERVVSEGGGVCINPNGLILTSARTIMGKMHGSDAGVMTGVRVRRHNSPVEIIHSLSLVAVQFDVALLWLKKKTPEEVFDYIPLADIDPPLVVNDRVFGYQHADAMVYSFLSGYVAYPVPPKHVKLGLHDTDFVGKESKFYTQAIDNNQPYRTLGATSDGTDRSVYHMHPQMPLVEVNGIHTTGTSFGYPIFCIRGGKVRLVGTMAFKYLELHYLLPSSFVYHITKSFFGRALRQVQISDAPKETEYIATDNIWYSSGESDGDGDGDGGGGAVGGGGGAAGGAVGGGGHDMSLSDEEY